MSRFQDCHYLRWARSQADPPYPEIPLTMSGMGAPDPGLFGALDTAALLTFPVGDHPPLAHRLAEEWKVAPERVLVQPGTHLSLYLLLAARLGERPGPIVVEEPAYEPLWRLAEDLGVEVLRWPRPRATGFGLDPDALDRLVDAAPSVVLLTQPHNPTGAVLGAEDVGRVAELVERSGCAVISDEVYLEFLDDPGASTLLGRCGDGAEVAITRSFTKVFGLGTLRASASVGPVGWIERAAAITDHLAVALPGPSQAVAQRVWDHRHALWQRAREAAAVGRSEVEAWARRMGDAVDVPLPEHGIICYPRLSEHLHRAVVRSARRQGVSGPSGFGLDVHEDGSHVWIEDLRRRRGVQITPGAFFGDERAFRLGFGIDPSVLRDGLGRLEEHLREAEAVLARTEAS